MYLAIAAMLAIGSGALAVTNQPGEITFAHPWQGPVYAHVHNHDTGHVYTGFFVDGTPCPIGVALPVAGGMGSDGVNYPAATKSLQMLPGLDTRAGESGWGIFQIDILYEGYIAPSGDILPQNTTNPLWQTGQNDQEIVGIMGGRKDRAVIFDEPGGANQRILSTDDQYEIYVQKDGTFNDGAPGTTVRNADGSYPTVGDDATSKILVNGYTQTGFYMDAGLLAGGVPMGICPESIAEFFPAGTSPGHNDLYINLYADGETIPAGDIGASGVLGGMNSPYDFDTDFFQGWACGPNVPYGADFRLHVTTTAINGFNDPFWGADYNWTVFSSDPLTGYYVPEPITVMGLFFGIGSLGCYLRRRRA